MRISDWSSDVCSSDLPNASNCGFESGWSRKKTTRHFSNAARISATVSGASGRRRSMPKISAPMTGVSGRTSSVGGAETAAASGDRSEEHTSELQSLMRISYAVFCLKKKKNPKTQHTNIPTTKTHTASTLKSTQNY